MFTVTVNDGPTHKADLKVAGRRFEGQLDGKTISGEFEQVHPYQYLLLYNGGSYRVDVVKLNAEDKTMTLRINSIRCTVALKDQYDELLHILGMDRLAANKAADMKAPMPGMVLEVKVKEGDVVKKGDALIVLEAMKMENILKAPADGTVKKIVAIKGNAVEKGQLLIQF